ncbi:hypothetical protein PINS_up002032 [Pythium insidiosum]|nr:hypothetical protein PINS_up002032 [Pythium insidiosum]
MKQREAEQLKELVTDFAPGASMDSVTSQRLSLLAIKYKELDKRHRDAEAALCEAKRVENGYAQLEVLYIVMADIDPTRQSTSTCHIQRKYAELEQAHLAQAALVQRLQRDKTKTVELEVRASPRVAGHTAR